MPYVLDEANMTAAVVSSPPPPPEIFPIPYKNVSNKMNFFVNSSIQSYRDAYMLEQYISKDKIEKIKMGEFIDKLMLENPEQVINLETHKNSTVMDLPKDKYKIMNVTNKEKSESLFNLATSAKLGPLRSSFCSVIFLVLMGVTYNHSMQYPVIGGLPANNVLKYTMYTLSQYCTWYYHVIGPPG